MIMMMFEVKRAIYKNVPQRIVMASIMGIYGHNRDEDIDDKDNFSISNKNLRAIKIKIKIILAFLIKT